MVWLAVPHTFRPPDRLEILSFVVRELHLLFRLDHLDPGLDDQFASSLLKCGETGCVVVIDSGKGEVEGMHRW